MEPNNQVRAQVTDSGENAANRLDNRLGDFILEDVSIRPRFEGPLDDMTLLMHGEHKDKESGILLFEHLDQLDPTDTPLEGDIDDGEPRAQPLDHLHGRNRADLVSDKIRFRLPKGMTFEKVRQDLAAEGVLLKGIRFARPTLEDVFVNSSAVLREEVEEPL